MKILIILPNWLGDAVMATPAIELLSAYYPIAEFTFVGSFVAIEALKYHPKCNRNRQREIYFVSITIKRHIIQRQRTYPSKN